MNRVGQVNENKKPQAVEVREMEIDDLPQVFHLGEKLFQAERVPNLYRNWDEYEVISLYQGDPEFCLVAELEDRIIGFVLGMTITKNRSAWKYGHLAWLGVDPAFQRQHIAKRLFIRFRDLMVANGFRMLVVDTEADNLPAIRFFQKMGFGNPERNVYMTLNLTTQRRISTKIKKNDKAENRPPHNRGG